MSAPRETTTTAGSPASFSDPAAVARYAEGPPRLVPGFDALHRMTDLLLAERAPADARVLVLGAGGGLELRHLAAAHPGWRFDGVDPSAEMLRLAKTTMGEHVRQAALHEGLIDNAPEGPFDAATCLLTLHFLPRDERLRTLEELRRRLRPGAPLVVAHHSFPQSTAEEKDVWLRRFAAFAVSSGVDPAMADGARVGIGARLPALDPQEDEAVLREAGFREVALFYAAFSFRGWVARA
ncbi:class I SAM-dependent methyltransferase [Patulibacter sp. NPDC049589]|uniref:class I SAM-dependent methyltransferase n=1 Tax=Patulibacter sp. NPDC049589 TaxID=3154731 RepID=UPI0034478101